MVVCVWLLLNLVIKALSIPGMEQHPKAKGFDNIFDIPYLSRYITYKTNTEKISLYFSKLLKYFL